MKLSSQSLGHRLHFNLYVLRTKLKPAWYSVCGSFAGRLIIIKEAERKAINHSLRLFSGLFPSHFCPCWCYRNHCQAAKGRNMVPIYYLGDFLRSVEGALETWQPKASGNSPLGGGGCIPPAHKRKLSFTEFLSSCALVQLTSHKRTAPWKYKESEENRNSSSCRVKVHAQLKWNAVQKISSTNTGSLKCK